LEVLLPGGVMADVWHRDIQVLKTYGAAPYAAALKKLEKQIKEKQQSVNEKIGVKVRVCYHYRFKDWAD
jgi:26S proteasome regulatory subunit T1